MTLTVNPQKFEELIKKSHSLDHIYLLKLIEQKFDISPLYEDSMKISALVSGLIRKGLMTNEYKLTILGQELLIFAGDKTGKKLPKVKIVSEEFDVWWEIFPSSNKFEYKGISFDATRAFKVKKDDCKLLFTKYINEKTYTANEMIEATKYDVQLRKINSFTKKENQLTYLQNTYTYLYQMSFQGYVDLIKEGIKLKETSTNYEGINI